MSLLLLTTLADVKQLFAEQQTTVGPDALLTLMIPAVSARIEQHLNRKLMLEERTETLSPAPYAQLLILGAAPVTVPDEDTGLPVFTVTEAVDRQFAGIDPLDASTYYLDADAGLVHYDGQFSGGKGSVRVTYTAGLAATPADVKANYPAVWQAATFWVKELYQKRNQLGRSGSSVSGTSVSWEDGLGKMPAVVETLLAPMVRQVISG